MNVNVTPKLLRKRRTGVALLFLLLFAVVQIFGINSVEPDRDINNQVLSEVSDPSRLASTVLEQLTVKGRAPKTGYSRSEFSDGWAKVGDCDVRNLVLARDLREVELGADGCVVTRGVLIGPYTGQEIQFVRGSETSSEVQIDHVVALSDAWQKGAQQLSKQERLRFANDGLNLLAVDGPANQRKSNSDAASWLPPNRNYRCRYVARQIAVKKKYRLWVTSSEKSAMARQLNGCKDQPLPIEAE